MHFLVRYYPKGYLETYKTIEPQKRKGHKGAFYIFLCVPQQQHCAFVIQKFLCFSLTKL
jgi:hypothetical protein